MVTAGGGSVATAVRPAAAAERLVHHGAISDKKCRKKVPRKAHKSEREKLKRGHLNDLFSDLGNMLEADRQSNGKACILTDTTRILRDLLSQVESLRHENSTLQNESNYVTMERNELQDENGVLRNEISGLQNELRLRVTGNPGWSHSATESPLPVPRSPSTVFPSQQPMQPSTMTSTVFPLQQPLLPQPTVVEHSYARQPLELKLFLEAPAVESQEPSENLEALNHVARPQARYPTEASSWPISLGLPRMEDEQCSSSTTCSSKIDSTGRD
ncbi:protein IRON-RELATED TRANSCRIPTION FACTOR 3-like [Oryza brachyantha]|uniref:BHLH domain-containing protein n=1 Tax=Oryza brachyantha TaxID=4533 RepID=J3LP87_ORYBR|nr:protein IRON-RELATED TRANSCRIPTION FACTOR 3-like [Oryza brachyantha]